MSRHRECRRFYQAKRELVRACNHHARSMERPALLLLDESHDEFMRARAEELGVNPLVRVESQCGAACVAFTLEHVCQLLEGAGDDVEVARAALQHSSGPTPLLILHGGKYLLVQPGVAHARA